MSNPFDDLKRKREQDEHKRLDSQHTAQKASDEYEKAVERYTPMAVGILTDLRDAAYPNAEVITGSYKSDCWRIEEQHEDWRAIFVRVQLLTDKSGNAAGFRCYHGPNHAQGIECGPSRKELIDTLRQIHDRYPPRFLR